ncbi:MAG: cobalamin adenosyltransferase [Cellulosilyticaceae bacterium]
MAVITEDDIRRMLSKNHDAKIKEFCVTKGMLLTPSAKSYLIEKGISTQYENEIKKESVPSKMEEDKVVYMPEKKGEVATTYDTLFGAKLDYKPEHMTHLRGNLLVFKDHKRIILRGKLDSLESKILEVQLISVKNGLPQVADELEEVLKFTRNLMSCEVSGKSVGEFRVIGLDEKELREQSHHPSQYFGIKHFLPDYKMGEVVVGLNSLRSLTREVELAAYQAFKGEYGEVEREDIIRAFNRLSSLFWIMMFKVRSNRYQ